MVNRKPPSVEPIGNVVFTDLEPEIQDDVVASLATDVFDEPEDDVRAGLENGPAALPLILVDPNDIYDGSRNVSESVVEAYAQSFREGDEFPPVVIDSSRPGAIALLEGGHRTAAAVDARVPRIVALDLAGARIVKTPEGLETFSFGKEVSPELGVARKPAAPPVLHLWKKGAVFPVLEPLRAPAVPAVRVAGKVLPKAEVRRRGRKFAVQKRDKPRWRAVAGDQIEVSGDVGLEPLRTAAVYIELLRKMLAEQFGDPDRSGIYRVRVFADYQEFRQHAVYRGAPQAAAFYDPRTMEISYWFGRYTTPALYQRAFAHEVTHAYMDLAWGRWSPLWFAEGMAEYFSNLSWDPEDKRFVPGERDAKTVLLLRMINLVPLRRFLELGRDEFYGVTFAPLYAQAWALVDFLIAEHPEIVQELLKRGTVAMDLSELDEPFREYVLSSK